MLPCNRQALARETIPKLCVNLHSSALILHHVEGLHKVWNSFHAVFPISTGKLEGFNNKTKVAKRIGYGYRDDDYFFTLIRYFALPSLQSIVPNFP